MNRKKGLAALAIICVVWGTTYFAIRIGIQSFPPMLFSAIRQLFAGIILLVLIFFTGNKFDWTLGNLLRQSLLGFLLIFLGNGMMTLAEVYIPSGLAALLASLVPLHIVVINLISTKQRVIHWKIIVGLLLGLSGMVFIFRDSLSDLGNHSYYKGILSAITATVGWSVGTVLSKKINVKSTTSYHNTALQFLAGGTMLSITGLLFEGGDQLLHTDVKGWLVLGYLVLFGSIVGFLCYHYAIKTLQLNTVALYAYINPLVAILLGCLFLGEQFSIAIGVAFVLTIAGLFLVNSGNQHNLKKV